MQIAKAFGIAVRGIREKAGISQEALAEQAGLDRTYVSGVERGVRNPTLRVIHKLACGLNVSEVELFSEFTKANKRFTSKG